METEFNAMPFTLLEPEQISKHHPLYFREESEEESSTNGEDEEDEESSNQGDTSDGTVKPGHGIPEEDE